ncbi:MerR family transcriptional regulator [Herbiconiux sp. P18]|uniref:MerR family transcriptional regulator n=1 Tax=Herbiconiux liangxiaofengii TaxID=3342795 RepID=UPI003CF41FE1
MRSLRYYEEQGLLAPRRTTSGQRVYAADDVRVVARIQDLFGAGFCSSVIRELLPGVRNELMSTCHQFVPHTHRIASAVGERHRGRRCYAHAAGQTRWHRPGVGYLTCVEKDRRDRDRFDSSVRDHSSISSSPSFTSVRKHAGATIPELGRRPRRSVADFITVAKL